MFVQIQHDGTAIYKSPAVLSAVVVHQDGRREVLDVR